MGVSCLCPEVQGCLACAEIGNEMGIAIELIGSYGLWVVLIALFLAMHWFGMHCCGRRHLKPTRRLYTGTGPEGHGSDTGRDA